MDAQSIYPFVAAYGFKQADGFTFLLPGKEVNIEGANEILPILLAQCNGYQTLQRIIALTSEKTGFNEEELRQLVETLLIQRILVDAPRYYELFHNVSSNPMPFLRDVSEEDVATMLQNKTPLVGFSQTSRTPFEMLLEKRSSVREFSGKPLTREEILRLAWAIYGRAERSEGLTESSIGLGTVPSGGALYPLRLFVLARQDCSNWTVYNGGSQELHATNRISNQQVLRAFLEDSTLEDAAAVYVLTCDFQQTTQKYSNRGYRYALLEAGHAAQNAYLWCAEQEIGVVEVGGFLDEELANLLLLSYPNQAPLTTLIVGRRNPS